MRQMCTGSCSTYRRMALAEWKGAGGEVDESISRMGSGPKIEGTPPLRIHCRREVSSEGRSGDQVRHDGVVTAINGGQDQIDRELSGLLPKETCSIAGPTEGSAEIASDESDGDGQATCVASIGDELVEFGIGSGDW